MLFSVATATTDDRGEFRLFGLAPGAYYVSASDPAFASVSTPKGVLHYSADLLSRDHARRRGAHRDDRRQRAAAARGVQAAARAAGAGQRAARRVRHEAAPQRGHHHEPARRRRRADGRARGPAALPDGRFSFAGVAPGRYQIRARGQTDPVAAALFAVYSVEVLGDDVDGIQMTLRPGAMLDGTSTVEAPRGEPPAQALDAPRARAVRRRQRLRRFADRHGASRTGSIALRGIMKGTHQLVVDGLQPPWVVKSVRYRGTDITDRAARRRRTRAVPRRADRHHGRRQRGERRGAEPAHTAGRQYRRARRARSVPLVLDAHEPPAARSPTPIRTAVERRRAARRRILRRRVADDRRERPRPPRSARGAAARSARRSASSPTPRGRRSRCSSPIPAVR